MKRDFRRSEEPVNVLIMRELFSLLDTRSPFTIQDVARAVRRHRSVRQTSVRRLVTTMMQQRDDYRRRLVDVPDGKPRHIWRYEPIDGYQMCPMCHHVQATNRAILCDECGTLLPSAN